MSSFPLTIETLVDKAGSRRRAVSGVAVAEKIEVVAQDG